MFRYGVFIVGVNWEYSFCDYCLRNAHEKVAMVRQNLVSTFEDSKFSEEYWICPKCGSDKKL